MNEYSFILGAKIASEYIRIRESQQAKHVAWYFLFTSQILICLSKVCYNARNPLKSLLVLGYAQAKAHGPKKNRPRFLEYP